MAAYDAEGSFDRAAYLLGMNRKTFSKLWRDLIGAAPPRAPHRAKRGHLEDTDVHTVAFMSDLHFGSRYQCMDELKDFVKLAKRRGVDTLVCLGDLSDGLSMHEGMAEEQFLHKPKDILNYIVDNYPRGFTNSYFITGNHDFSLQKAGCMNIGQEVAERRDDLFFLGHDTGLVTLEGGLEVYLHHGTGGCAELRSKRQQDIAVKFACARKGDVPHAMVTGHCHTENVIPQYMGMLSLSLGCFQRQTPYLAGRLLSPDVSGMILSYQVINDRLTNPALEFIRYDV